MVVLIGIIAGAAIIAWLVAFVSGILLLGHVAPEHSAADLLFKGYLFFQRDTFKESGHKIHGVMLTAMLGFFLAILLGIGVGAVMMGK